jgi:hypothetical protein
LQQPLVAVYDGLIKGGESRNRDLVRLRLSQWQSDADLAGLRQADAPA